jgi:hypothetical protein
VTLFCVPNCRGVFALVCHSPRALLARRLVNLRHFVYNGPSCVPLCVVTGKDWTLVAYFSANTLLNSTSGSQICALIYIGLVEQHFCRARLAPSEHRSQ